MEMIRKSVYPVDAVLNMVDSKCRKKREFDGDVINLAATKFWLFKLKGVKCVKCGLEASYFAKERYAHRTDYHLNLYVVVDGREMLMTKDHIIPKSKGGSSYLPNLQPMCYDCNQKKADKLEVQ